MSTSEKKMLDILTEGRYNGYGHPTCQTASYTQYVATQSVSVIIFSILISTVFPVPFSILFVLLNEQFFCLMTLKFS